MYNTPILVIIFNRPGKVRELMKALEKVRPARLFISADGPRPNRPEDIESCAESRRIATNVSWPCEVRTNFSDKNLGVDNGVEEGVNWFFTQVDCGIILEDDCIPHPDFFKFAEMLLKHYEDNQRIMMISGDNFQNGVRRGNGDYYFSRYPNTWGWATWRRAWSHYDTHLTSLPDFISERKISSIRPNKEEQRHWLGYFHKLYTGKHTPWDAKWVFAIWNQDGVCITPNVNLVQNIGMGKDATHTRSGRFLPGISDIGMPGLIKHPSSFTPDEAADSYLYKTLYKVTFWKLLKNTLEKYLL